MDVELQISATFSMPAPTSTKYCQLMRLALAYAMVSVAVRSVGGVAAKGPAESSIGDVSFGENAALGYPRAGDGRHGVVGAVTSGGGSQVGRFERLTTNGTVVQPGSYNLMYIKIPKCASSTTGVLALRCAALCLLLI
jgi:hypothetical protein